MSIRDNYESAFDAIAQHCGQEPSPAQIGPHDSLQKMIGYTRQFVVEQTTPHFRYQYYHDALSLAITRLRFGPANRRVVHLDIGCGPGVFSWVIYDHMASQVTRDPSQVDYYGYDHSAAMIQLAHLFLERFPVQYEFHGFSDLVEISRALADEDFSNCDVVVTFVPHPVPWTHICAMPPGVAHTPRAPRSACDTQASRDARSGCTAPRSRPRRRGRPRGSERFGRGSLAP